MYLSLEHSISAPIDSVFRFFSDPRQRPLWQRSLKSVSIETEGEPRQGTRWRESPLGLGEVSMEITKFQPPTRWAERGQSKLGQLDLSLSFEDHGSVTRLKLEAELRPPRWLGWCARLGKPLLLKEITSDLERATALLERQAPNA